MNQTVQIFTLPHAQDLPLPAYATPGAAAFDFVAAIDAARVIGPREHALIPTGLKMALPEGFELQVRPRSGLAFKNGITVLNSPGTIDADYRGEIGVILFNTSDVPFTVQRGDRIAQGVLARYEQAAWNSVASEEELGITARGAGGFGSTGIKA